MKEHIRIPGDPGRFGCLYSGANATIQFEYEDERSGKTVVGEFFFDFCLELNIVGRQDVSFGFPYDVLVIIEENVNVGSLPFQINKFGLMLSDSDFQFSITAKKCIFRPLVSKTIIGIEY